MKFKFPFVLKVILPITFFVFGLSTSFAQKGDLGFMYGATNYWGDLQPGASLQTINTCYGIWGKINTNPYWGIRGGIFRGSVGSADSLSTTQWRNDRNLSFQTNITEVNINAEFNFLKFIPNSDNFRWTPYIYAGVGMFWFNPTAQYNGKTVELQPLGTEGQSYVGNAPKSPYKLQSFCIPIGAGIKYNFFNYHSIGLELSARRTFTDYLDDVSGTYGDYDEILDRNGLVAAELSDRSPELLLPNNDPGKIRGNSATKDWYNYVSFVYIYTFKSSTCPAFR